MSYRAVINQVVLANDEIVSCNNRPRCQRVGKGMKKPAWTTPPLGWIKINCDGTFKEEDQKEAYGLIVRNPDGGIQWCESGVMAARFPLLAEAWAVIRACNWAVENNSPATIIESDSKMLIESLQKGPPHSWILGSLLST